MYYRISQKINLQDGRWKDYVKWAGLENCQEFYSIDGLMRPSLFNPESAEDWQNCVNADFKIHLITNLDYAQKVLSSYSTAEILGVLENPKSSRETIPPGHILMGYDILDAYNDISLLTNWGGKQGGIQPLKLNRYALLDDLDVAYELKGMLRQDFPKDEHANACEVWAVYKIIWKNA